MSRRWLVAGLGLALLVAAGCGGDGEDRYAEQRDEVASACVAVSGGDPANATGELEEQCESAADCVIEQLSDEELEQPAFLTKLSAEDQVAVQGCFDEDG